MALEHKPCTKLNMAFPVGVIAIFVNRSEAVVANIRVVATQTRMVQEVCVIDANLQVTISVSAEY